MLKRFLAAISLLTLALMSAVPAAPFPGVPRVPPVPGIPLFPDGPAEEAVVAVPEPAGRASAGHLPGREDARGMHRSVDPLRDAATGTLVRTSPAGDLGDVTSLVFSPDGESLFCCDQSATSRIDARTGQTRQDLTKAGERRGN